MIDFCFRVEVLPEKVVSEKVFMNLVVMEKKVKKIRREN